LTALLSLEPRVAGAEVIEPAVSFAENEDRLHDSARCPISLICQRHTNICGDTGL
jgi:hypothetical protein